MEGEGEGLGFSRHTKDDKKGNYCCFFSAGHKIHVNTEYLLITLECLSPVSGVQVRFLVY